MRALVSKFKLSSRDLVEMMNEREIPLAHTTILRWGATLRARIREALATVSLFQSVDRGAAMRHMSK